MAVLCFFLCSFLCIKELFHIAFNFPMERKDTILCEFDLFNSKKIEYVSFFYAKNNMSNHFVKDHSSIVRTIVAQKVVYGEKKATTLCYKWKMLVCRLQFCQFGSGLTKDQLRMKYMYRLLLLWTHTHTQGENQKKHATNWSETCVYAPCQMDIKCYTERLKLVIPFIFRQSD